MAWLGAARKGAAAATQTDAMAIVATNAILLFRQKLRIGATLNSIASHQSRQLAAHRSVSKSRSQRQAK